MSVGGVFYFIFAFLFAVALNNSRFRGRKFFQTMIFFPSFISAVGVAVFWKLLYDAKSGLINLTLEGMGVSAVQWLSPDNTITSVIIMIVWAGVGGKMILLLAGMRRIPKDYYEAAEIDGATVPQQFFHVTVPMMREVIIIALSLWMIGSLKVFGFVQALMGSGMHDKCQVVSTLQYEYAFSNRACTFLMGRATAMAVAQLAVILLLVGIVRLFREKESLEY
jgi:ABC-type sugar transport system permease subunit